jgi:anthranilate synthase component 1
MVSIMDFQEFERLASSHNLIPMTKSVLADTLTPVSAYLRLRRESTMSFLLESVEGGERFARYSFIGRNPAATLRCTGRTTVVTENGLVHESTEDFFTLIDRMIRRFRQPTIPSLPRFTGGVVGCIGYDAVRFIESIPDAHCSTSPLPDSVMGLFTSIVAFDHLKHHVTLIHNTQIDPSTTLRQQYDDALAQIDQLEQAIFTPIDRPSVFRADINHIDRETSKEQFVTNVHVAKKHISDGDIFQVVLSQRASCAYTGDLFNVYRALRLINPSPYLYYLDFGDAKIIGSSPEILVRKEEDIAEIDPIAGTRSRGATNEEDRQMEFELLADEKERAEHVMLVDLGRNDLGRVCEPGTVNVDQLMAVVRYSHVMHLASRVVGKVTASTPCIEVLRAAFPAGTVSGAPKIRAMQIIDALEQSRRGMYAGGVGYFDFSGNMDTCIAIRTIIATEERLYFQAGAGIVADSIPEREYDETVHKARVLVEALRMAGRITH